VRALVDIGLFRPLLRSTPSVNLHGRGLSAYEGRLLWLVALAFHGSLAVIALRHLRLFLTPVPRFVAWLHAVDSVSDLFIPKLHVTSVLIVIALGWLIARRLMVVRLRYISLAADYFPLLLLLGIATTGIVMRHVTRTDVSEVKAMVESAAQFSFAVVAPVDTLLVVHVFLVCALLLYFPLSKLMHMPGALMSPTLTLAANSRAKHHVNVNNPAVPTLHYADYEATFRDRMIAAGIPVEEK
jgi:nitrate reductase gamma subunit